MTQQGPPGGGGGDPLHVKRFYWVAAARWQVRSQMKPQIYRFMSGKSALGGHLSEVVKWNRPGI